MIELVKRPKSNFDSCIVVAGKIELIFEKKGECLDWTSSNPLGFYFIQGDEFHKIIALVRKEYDFADHQLSFSFKEEER